MINKRLIGTVPDSKKYIAANVLCQWLALLANIVLMAVVARLLAGLWQNTVDCGRTPWNPAAWLPWGQWGRRPWRCGLSAPPWPAA